MNKKLLDILKVIFQITVPYITELIHSKVVPMLKRQAYEKVDNKIDNLIQDLAQNANKILKEDDDVKQFAYVEGTKLGIDTLRAMAEKLNKAADEIEKVIK